MKEAALLYIVKDEKIFLIGKMWHLHDEFMQRITNIVNKLAVQD